MCCWWKSRPCRCHCTLCPALGAAEAQKVALGPGSPRWGLDLLSPAIACSSVAGTRHHLLSGKGKTSVVLSQSPGLAHACHLLKQGNCGVDKLPPQAQGHSPGQGASSPSEAHSFLCALGWTFLQSSKDSCSRKHWFSVCLFKVCGTGLSFLQGAACLHTHSEAVLSDLVPVVNPWQRSGMTVAHDINAAS